MENQKNRYETKECKKIKCQFNDRNKCQYHYLSWYYTYPSKPYQLVQIRGIHYK